MLVKICKKAALILAVVMLLTSVAMAAPSLVGRASNDADSLEQEIEGGIRIRADSARCEFPHRESLGCQLHKSLHL